MKEMTLKEMQNFELDILKDFHEFCVSNNIRYSLDGGTLIGAIRHKGFIPWDDDIDVVLPRPDYEKLCSLYQSEKYRLKCFQNDKNCYLGFARIYDFKYTTFDTRYPWCKDKNVGLWIDIFPADGAPDNEDELQKLYGKVLEYRMKTMKPRYAKAHFSFHGSIHSNLSILMEDSDFEWRFCKKIYQKTDGNSSNVCFWKHLAFCLSDYYWRAIGTYALQYERVGFVAIGRF